MSEQLEDNVIGQVQTIIDWWHEFNDAGTVEDKLTRQNELAVLSWYLAKESADAKTKYNVDAFMRNINTDRTTQKLIEEKSMTKAKAEIDARLINREYYEEYLQSQAYAYKLDILIKQVNRILSAMQQTISYDKEELKRAGATVQHTPQPGDNDNPPF